MTTAIGSRIQPNLASIPVEDATQKTSSILGDNPINSVSLELNGNSSEEAKDFLESARRLARMENYEEAISDCISGSKLDPNLIDWESCIDRLQILQSRAQILKDVAEASAPVDTPVAIVITPSQSEGLDR